jgi:hypothetical protein
VHPSAGQFEESGIAQVVSAHHARPEVPEAAGRRIDERRRRVDGDLRPRVMHREDAVERTACERNAPSIETQAGSERRSR